MFLIPLSCIVFVFMLCRFVWPLKISRGAKLCVAAVVGLVSFKYIIYRYVGGSIAAPDFPASFLIAMEVLFLTLLGTGALVGVRDGVAVLVWILRKVGLVSQDTKVSGLDKNLAAVFVAFSLIISSYGVWNASKVPAVRTVEIVIPNLPKAFDGYTIVQLTDTHIGPILQDAWLREVVAKTMTLKPDMIVFTGDFIDGEVENVAHMLAPLADLKAPDGVYGVVGNHEYISAMPRWDAVLRELGLDMLHNEQRHIERGDATFVLAGVTDPASRFHGLTQPDRAKALGSDDNRQGDSFTILLDHQSKNAFQNPHADLQLSGHTHGGQMYLFEYIVALANGGFVRGLYEQDGQQLYVSAGTGLWHGFSCRLGIDSEITKIVLR